MKSSKPSWRLFTISNILSIVRILLIAPIIFCILSDDSFYFNLGLVLIALAIISDYLDGMLARKLNQTSEIGKILDPLADKLAVSALIIVLIIYKDFPIWVAVVIIGRDLLILLAGLIWATKHKFVLASNVLGKFTVFMIAMMIVVYILDLPLLEKILTYNAVFFTILSGIVYFNRFLKSLNTTK